MVEGDLECARQILRIERRQALVEHHEAASLQQRPRHVKTTALAMGQLPARVSHHLLESRGHPADQLVEAQGATAQVQRTNVAPEAPAPKKKRRFGPKIWIPIVVGVVVVVIGLAQRD